LVVLFETLPALNPVPRDQSFLGC